MKAACKILMKLTLGEEGSGVTFVLRNHFAKLLTSLIENYFLDL